MLGPDDVRILESVQKTGSIRSAARATGISYVHARKLLQKTKDVFRAAVIERQIGGRRGGGASLNQLGQRIVRHYRAIEAKAARAIRSELAALNRLKLP